MLGQPQLNHCAAHISRSAECDCMWTHTWWLKPALTYISGWWQAAAGKWVCGAVTEKNMLQPNTCCWSLRQASRTEHREEHHDHGICTEQQDGTCSCEKNTGYRTWAQLFICCWTWKNAHDLECSIKVSKTIKQLSQDFSKNMNAAEWEQYHYTGKNTSKPIWRCSCETMENCSSISAPSTLWCLLWIISALNLAAPV